MVHSGRVAEGDALAADLVKRYADNVPTLLVAQALLPSRRGDDAASVRALEGVLRDPRVTAHRDVTSYAQTSLDLLRRDATAGGPDA